MNTSLYGTPRIFISHSNKDNNFTKRLVEDLRRVLDDDTAVWYDYKLRGGDSWWRKIVNELTARNIFIVVLSPDAIRSDWVNDEIDLAWKQKNSKAGKFIIPVLYRTHRKKRHDLDKLQSISFLPSRTYDSAFDELLEVLGLERPSNIETSRFLSNFEGLEINVIRQRVLKLEKAFDKEVWDYVIGEVDTLSKQYSGAIPSSLYRMQGLAYLYKGKTRHAQDTLAKALALENVTEQRLILLDEYTGPFISQHQWDKVLFHAKEALLLAPNDRTWQIAQEEALKKIDQNNITVFAHNQNRVVSLLTGVREWRKKREKRGRTTQWKRRK